MYRRTPDKTPPPGYGGTTFLRTDWPPPAPTPPIRKSRDAGGSFVPFVPAPPPVIEEAEVVELPPEPDPVPAPPTPPPVPHAPALPTDETLLLLGVFLLLTESDLLLALAVLFLL